MWYIEGYANNIKGLVANCVVHCTTFSENLLTYKL